MADYNRGNPKIRKKIKGNNPRKYDRPLSQMAPTFVLRKKSKKVVGVFGGTGGRKIPAAIANVMMTHYYRKKKIEYAVRAFRLFNLLIPKVYFFDFYFL